MPRVIAKADTLKELSEQFEFAPLTTPVFLNSVPKCGTHLMRNILRMFVSHDQQYHRAFIQIPILRQHLAAFSRTKPQLSWGHLLFSDESAIALRQVNHILLVRDPYDWVLARARFFLSDSFDGSVEHLKGGNVSVDEMLNMMILGIHAKVPAMQDIFLHNAVGWLGTKVHVYRYEELVKSLQNVDSDRSANYFSALARDCGLAELPHDWRARVRIGADRKQSGTARENLGGQPVAVPEVLPDLQKQMVDLAVPGLRRLLGYTDA